MKSKFALVAALVAVAAPPIAMTVPTTAASAQTYDRYGNRVYRGNSRNYRYRCKRSSGTTGLLAGGAGGALIGNAIGGGVLGTVAGGVGGALLGKHLDKKHDAAQNRRNGC